MDVPAKNAGEYARNLLKILFTQQELQSCLLPSQQAKRYAKSELDHERMKLLNGKGKSVLLSSGESFLLCDFRSHSNALSYCQVSLSLLLQGANSIHAGCVFVQRRTKKIEETSNSNGERKNSRGSISRPIEFDHNDQF